MLVDGLYTVADGDTLSSIALEYNLTVEAIVEMNDIQDSNELYIGEKLILIPSDVTAETQSESGYSNDLEISEADKTLLAQLVYNEANNQSKEGKKAVVDVVINRMLDVNYPNTASEVILQKGQFSNSDILHTLPVTEDNMEAVESAVNGFDITNGALFFWNPSICESTYMDSLEVVAVIGDHEFLK